jgi:hypothetical protein
MDAAWILKRDAMKHVEMALFAFLAAMAAAGSTLADEAKWGDLKLQFVYDGQPPEPKLLPVAPGAPFAPVDETWVVNPKNKSVANVVVYLDYQRDEKLLVHPDLKKPKDREAKVNIMGNRFDPHVTIMRTDQSLVVTNGDPFGHNVKADFLQNASFNVLLATGEKTEQWFQLPERAPSFLSDAIHPQMTGHLLICNHPYFARSDENGQMVIPKLAVGKHAFRAWHEAIGLMGAPVQAGKPIEWKRGIIEIEIKEGGTDLGVFAIKKK